MLRLVYDMLQTWKRKQKPFQNKVLECSSIMSYANYLEGKNKTTFKGHELLVLRINQV